MCGIAGIYNLRGGPLPPLDPSHVLASIRHRGPDDEGWFTGPGVFLGARRLAIIDPAGGRQPATDQAGRVQVVMNGEIFDYEQLIRQLQARGHNFKSHCDSELLAHLLAERWVDALDLIDGQYAFAAFDTHANRLLLARDRMGICPLFYARVGDCLVFASECKAIFATGLLAPTICRRSMDAMLAFGCVPAPRAMFEGISALPPGRLLEVRNGAVTQRTYWDIPYNDAGQYPRRSVADWAGEFRDTLSAAAIRRLRADVPVGYYLSGGIDSATVAALSAGHGNGARQAFSIGFPEPGFDESGRTRQLADFLGIDLNLLTYRQADLARDLPRLVYHAEAPLVTTESVPLLALSGQASKYVKVVLSGQGADEALGGYLYFRWEAAQQAVGTGLMRKFLLAIGSPFFSYFLGKRNPFVPMPADQRWAEQVFGYHPAIMMKFFYFRMIRELVYTDAMLQRQRRQQDGELIDLPRERMSRWDRYNRTLYLASRIFMANHLLATQGDRALMANSVEGRYPFLDRRVQEFLGQVPPGLKTTFRREKYLLRRAMAGHLPRQVVRRVKKPFLAPFGTQFVGADVTDQLRELLGPRMLQEFGYFDPGKVARLIEFLTREKQAIARDPGESMRAGRNVVARLLPGMALTFVASMQILEYHIRSGRFTGRA